MSAKAPSSVVFTPQLLLEHTPNDVSHRESGQKRSGSSPKDPPTAVASPSATSRFRLDSVDNRVVGEDGAVAVTSSPNNNNSITIPPRAAGIPTPRKDTQMGSTGVTTTEKVMFTSPSEGINKFVVLGRTLRETWLAISMLSPRLAAYAKTLTEIGTEYDVSNGEYSLVACSAADEELPVASEADFRLVRASLARGERVLKATLSEVGHDTAGFEAMAPGRSGVRHVPSPPTQSDPSPLAGKFDDGHESQALPIAGRLKAAAPSHSNGAGRERGHRVLLSSSSHSPDENNSNADRQLNLSPEASPLGGVENASARSPFNASATVPLESPPHDNHSSKGEPRAVMADPPKRNDSRLPAQSAVVGLHSDPSTGSITNTYISMQPSTTASGTLLATNSFGSMGKRLTAAAEGIRAKTSLRGVGEEKAGDETFEMREISQNDPHHIPAASDVEAPAAKIGWGDGKEKSDARSSEAGALRPQPLSKYGNISVHPFNPSHARTSVEGISRPTKEANEDGFLSSPSRLRAPPPSATTVAVVSHSKPANRRTSNVGESVFCGAGGNPAIADEDAPCPIVKADSDTNQAQAHVSVTTTFDLSEPQSEDSNIGDKKDGDSTLPLLDSTSRFGANEPPKYSSELDLGSSDSRTTQDTVDTELTPSPPLPKVRIVGGVPPPRYARIRFCFMNENIVFRPHTSQGWFMRLLRGGSDSVHCVSAHEAGEVGSNVEKKNKHGRRNVKSPTRGSNVLALANIDKKAPTAFSFDPIDPVTFERVVPPTEATMRTGYSPSTNQGGGASSHFKSSVPGPYANINLAGPYYSISTVDPRTGDRSYMCWANNRFEARATCYPFGAFVIEPFEFPKEHTQGGGSRPATSGGGVSAPRRRSLGLMGSSSPQPPKGEGGGGGGHTASINMASLRNPVDSSSNRGGHIGVGTHQLFTIRSAKGFLCKGARKGIVHSVEPNSLSIVALDTV